MIEKLVLEIDAETAAVIEQAIICLGHSYVFRDQSKGDKIYVLAEPFRNVRSSAYSDMQLGVNNFVRR